MDSIHSQTLACEVGAEGMLAIEFITDRSQSTALSHTEKLKVKTSLKNGAPKSTIHEIFPKVIPHQANSLLRDFPTIERGFEAYLVQNASAATAQGLAEFILIWNLAQSAVLMNFLFLRAAFFAKVI